MCESGKGNSGGSNVTLGQGRYRCGRHGEVGLKRKLGWTENVANLAIELTSLFKLAFSRAKTPRVYFLSKCRLKIAVGLAVCESPGNN